MIKQDYRTQELSVKVREYSDAYFYALKDQTPLFCALKITVYRTLEEENKEEFLGMYYKEWEQETSVNTINRFIKKVLEDAGYRKDYLSEGRGFDEIIPFADDDGVNKKCREAIQRLQKKKGNTRNFKDYLKLKTFGIDKYSRAKKDVLASKLTERELKLAHDTFVSDEKAEISCLRWCCRGLSIKHAIRKVKTDLEVAENIKR